MEAAVNPPSIPDLVVIAGRGQANSEYCWRMLSEGSMACFFQKATKFG